MSLDDHLVALDRSLDAHLSQHADDRLCPIAFLVGKTSHTCKTAGALAECRQNGYDREEVRTVRRIDRKSLERRTLNRDVSPVAVELRKARAGIHQYVHDRKVGLEGCCVKSLNLSLSEDCSGYEEIGSSAPVSFQIDVRSLESLTALDLEDHLGTQRPVTVRSKEIRTSEHVVADLDAELLEHLEGDEHIWNALRLMNDERAVLLRERKGHKQARDELRAMFS